MCASDGCEKEEVPYGWGHDKSEVNYCRFSLWLTSKRVDFSFRRARVFSSYAINWKLDHARTWKGFCAARDDSRQPNGAAVRGRFLGIQLSRAWNGRDCYRPRSPSLRHFNWSKTLKVLVPCAALCKHRECKQFHTAKPPTVFTWKFKLLMSANEVDSSSLRLRIDFCLSFHYSERLIKALH